jgi:uncharacterized protein (TIGR02246 family)
MSRIIHVACLAGLVLALAPPAGAQGSAEEAVRARVKQFEAAYNAGDADRLAAIYAEDATHTYAFGVTHVGRSAIAQGLKDQFAGPMKGTRMSITPIRIRPLSQTIAVEEASFNMMGLKDPAGTELPPVGGFCLVVYQQQGSQWFVKAAQCMVPLVPPQPK